MSIYKTMEAAQLKMFCHKKSNESAYMFELPPFQYKIMTILLHMDIMSHKFYTTNQPLNGFKIPLHRWYKRKGKQPVLAILSFLFYFNRRIQSLAALIFLQNIK